MSKLTIPDELMSGFKNIEELSDVAFDKLVEAIKTQPEDSTSKVFVNAINDAVNNSDSKIGEVLLSLGSLIVDDTSTDDLPEELVKSYIDKQKGATTKEAVLLERLRIIFKINDQAVVMYKIRKLIAENSNAYRESDIITDIRLVFSEPPGPVKENQRRKGIIIHRLKLGYFKNGNYKEEFFSLDRNDLLSLRNVIERALLKEDNIKSDYSSSIDIFNL